MYKEIIIFFVCLLSFDVFSSGGCQYYSNSYEISHLKIKSSQHVNEFRIIARAPGVLQIKAENEIITTINIEGKSFTGSKSELQLVRENIVFEEFDGCASFLLRKTKRYIVTFKDRWNGRVYRYEWPLIKEFHSYYPIYSYDQEALMSY